MARLHPWKEFTRRKASCCLRGASCSCLHPPFAAEVDPHAPLLSCHCVFVCFAFDIAVLKASLFTHGLASTRQLLFLSRAAAPPRRRAFRCDLACRAALAAVDRDSVAICGLLSVSRSEMRAVGGAGLCAGAVVELEYFSVTQTLLLISTRTSRPIIVTCSISTLLRVSSVYLISLPSPHTTQATSHLVHTHFPIITHHSRIPTPASHTTKRLNTLISRTKITHWRRLLHPWRTPPAQAANGRRV